MSELEERQELLAAGVAPHIANALYPPELPTEPNFVIRVVWRAAVREQYRRGDVLWTPDGEGWYDSSARFIDSDNLAERIEGFDTVAKPI